MKGYEKPFSFIKQYGDTFIAVVCGGDGTVGWVMNELKKANLNPKIYVIPLGTGNDLSISTGWGGGYNGEDIEKLLSEIDNSNVGILDRWKISSSEDENDVKIFNNYFSIGIDAAIALSFHTKRNANPELFKGRVTNKLAYAVLSVPKITNSSDILNKVTLVVDGKQIELPTVEGISFLNVPTYGGGNRFWRNLTPKEMAYGFHQTHYGDGELEVVGFHSLTHLGRCVSGKKLDLPIKIAQGHKFDIILTQNIEAQIDGEPYEQQKTIMTIEHYQSVKMLVKNNYVIN